MSFLPSQQRQRAPAALRAAATSCKGFPVFRRQALAPSAAAIAEDLEPPAVEASR